MTIPHRPSSTTNPGKMQQQPAAGFSSHQPRRLIRQSSYRTLIESWRDVQATFSKELQRPSVFGMFEIPGSPESSSDEDGETDEEEEELHRKRRVSTGSTPFAPHPNDAIQERGGDYGDGATPHSDEPAAEICGDDRSGRSLTGPSNVCDPDFIPDNMHINLFELIFYACGVIGFFADTATDIILCHAYYKINEMWLFSLTLLCAIVPNIVLSLFSFAWHINEPRHYNPEVSDGCHATRVIKQAEGNNGTTRGAFTWVCRSVILLLQLDLCFKYVKAFSYTYRGYCYGLKQDRKWEKYYLSKQIHIDTDIALLRVFDVFMDSGAQVVLQLYVLASSPEKLCRMGIWNCGLNAKQILSIGCSLLSLSYTIAGYNRCLRQLRLTRRRSSWPHAVEPAPLPVPFTSTAVNFMWCVLIIIPRVLALALFASVSIKGFWIFVFLHWFVMLVWIVRSRTDFCLGSAASPHVVKSQRSTDCTNSDESEDHRRRPNSRKLIAFERCYNFVCSYVYIFCYMNLKSGPTRMRYLIYYTIFYIENVALSVIYYKLYRMKPVEDPEMRARISTRSYKTLMLCVIIIGFWIGLLIQLIYYLLFHPSKYVRRRLRCELFNSRQRQRVELPTNADHDNTRQNNAIFPNHSNNINNSSVNLMDLTENHSPSTTTAEFNETTLQTQLLTLSISSFGRFQTMHAPAGECVQRPRSESTPVLISRES